MCLTGGVHEKEHDFFSFHGVWLLFVFSLVASLLCLPPHCVLDMKWSRIVKGLVTLDAFYFFWPDGFEWTDYPPARR